MKRNTRRRTNTVPGPITACDGRVELCVDRYGHYVVQTHYDEDSWCLETLPDSRTMTVGDGPDLLVNVEHDRTLTANYSGEWDSVKSVPQSVYRRWRAWLQLWEEAVAKWDQRRADQQAIDAYHEQQLTEAAECNAFHPSPGAPHGDTLERYTMPSTSESDSKSERCAEAVEENGTNAVSMIETSHKVKRQPSERTNP